MFTFYQYAKCKIWNLLLCLKYGLYHTFNCFNHSTYVYQTMNDSVRRVLTTLKVNIWEYFNSFIFINHTYINVLFSFQQTYKHWAKQQLSLFLKIFTIEPNEMTILTYLKNAWKTLVFTKKFENSSITKNWIWLLQVI